MQYRVYVHEVHLSIRMVEADTPEEAKELAEQEEEVSCQYAYSLDPEHWFVEPVTQETRT